MSQPDPPVAPHCPFPRVFVFWTASAKLQRVNSSAGRPPEQCAHLRLTTFDWNHTGYATMLALAHVDDETQFVGRMVVHLTFTLNQWPADYQGDRRRIVPSATGKYRFAHALPPTVRESFEVEPGREDLAVTAREVRTFHLERLGKTHDTEVNETLARIDAYREALKAHAEAERAYHREHSVLFNTERWEAVAHEVTDAERAASAATYVPYEESEEYHRKRDRLVQWGGRLRRRLLGRDTAK